MAEAGAEAGPAAAAAAAAPAAAADKWAAPPPAAAVAAVAAATSRACRRRSLQRRAESRLRRMRATSTELWDTSSRFRIRRRRHRRAGGTATPSGPLPPGEEGGGMGVGGTPPPPLPAAMGRGAPPPPPPAGESGRGTMGAMTHADAPGEEAADVRLAVVLGRRRGGATGAGVDAHDDWVVGGRGRMAAAVGAPGGKGPTAALVVQLPRPPPSLSAAAPGWGADHPPLGAGGWVAPPNGGGGAVAPTAPATPRGMPYPAAGPYSSGASASMDADTLAARGGGAPAATSTVMGAGAAG